jgi:hypothetical protein
MEFLEKALAAGGEAIEIEYKDQKQWITAMRYHEGVGVGIGIGWLDSDAAKRMAEEMKELRKKKRVTIDGVRYGLIFSKYESFGEWVHRIQMKEANKTPAAKVTRLKASKTAKS